MRAIEDGSARRECEKSRLLARVVSVDTIRAMAGSGRRWAFAGPWQIFKADSGDVVVWGMCVPEGVAKGCTPKGEAASGGAKAVVEVMHRPHGSTDGRGSEWFLWIAWRGHARVVHLDVSRVCSRCGRLIVSAGVSSDGLVLIEH